VVVFQPAIDPLSRAPFTVTNLFRRAMPEATLPLRLVCQFLLQSGRGAWIYPLIATPQAT